MTLLITAFLAGILTVLAPCILPVLPIIIGGAAASGKESRRRTMRRAAVIVASLSISVFTFTLLLKATTALLGVPQTVWSTISGIIVILLGLYFLFPATWSRLISLTGLANCSNRSLYAHANRSGTFQSIMTGAALGPVFSSCSPTYALIIALVLPRSFAEGIVALLVYILGMAIVLLTVAYFGSRLTQKLGWTLDESGWFRRMIASLFIIIGVAILFGFDKSLQAWLLERGAYDGAIEL